MKEKVAIIKCPTYDNAQVVSSVRQIFDHFGGIQNFISPGQKVLIKPNLLFPTPAEKLVTTHPAVVGAVIESVKKAGGIPFVGDNPALQSALHVAKIGGIHEVCLKHGAPIVEFTAHQKRAQWRDSRFGTLGAARELFEYDVILNLAKLKAHDQMTLTLGVKNMFGGVSTPRRVWRHLHSLGSLSDFSRMILSTYLMIKPAFTIIDGIVAMERKGPRGGDPKNLGVLVGGINAVATDRVVTEIVSLPWEDLSILKAARDLEISGWDLSRIELCGTPLEDVRVNDFKFPPVAPINFELLRSLKIILRKLSN